MGAVLTTQDKMADIIADGIHVAPAMVSLFVRSKGEEHAVLISDAISATGMPDGTYQLGTFQVQVKGERCELDGKLAGSVLTLDRALRNVMSFAGFSLQQALKLVTRNPASLMGEEQRGTLSAGDHADLVLLTEAGEVVHTMVTGRMLQN